MKHALVATALSLVALTHAVAAAADEPRKPLTLSAGSAVALAAQLADLVPVPAEAKRAARAALAKPCKAGGTGTVTIEAKAIACHESHVATGSFICDVTAMNDQVRSVRGRVAHELKATLAEAGVRPEGAAGQEISSVGAVSCTLDLKLLGECAGGGAGCTLATEGE